MASLGGSSDNMENEEDWAAEVRPKRQRNEAGWAKNKRKRMKAEGKEYVNAKGVTVEARQTGGKCRQVR